MKNRAIMQAILVTISAFSTGLMGCAHSAHNHGSVALKHSDQEADVCLGKDEVKPGDRVSLFRNECKPRSRSSKRGGDSPSCKKIKLGEGEVAQVLNEHYSTIRVDKGTSFAEGTIVEKQ